jgi:hypothetical protein
MQENQMTLRQALERKRDEMLTVDIPEHEHTHSLYVHCLDCRKFGIDMPTRFVDATQCGNCLSMHTYKMYPSCCVFNDRLNIFNQCLELLWPCVEALEKIQAAVNEQAEDEGLWSVPWEGLQPVAEAYLQQELRNLHMVIEKNEPLKELKGKVGL